MKKVSLVLVIFMLITGLLIFNVNASETPPETPAPAETTNADAVQTENNDVNNEEIIENSEDSIVEANENNTIDTIAKVLEAKETQDIKSGNITERTQEVRIEIIEGDYIGEEFTTTYVLSYDLEGQVLSPELKEGDKVVVQIVESGNGMTTATVQDVARSNYIIVFFFIFLLSILIIGGKQGLKTIISLVLTLCIIYFILIKGTYSGRNAIIQVFMASALSIIVTFLIIGGINKKVLTAGLGTLGGIVCAGIVALIFINTSKMTGSCENAIQLSVNFAQINFNFKDILFAGVVISSLGACMDVGMTIVTVLDEIRKDNIDITWQELFKNGMHAGKEAIGTMTNTLILAYFGSTLTLILLFMTSNMGIIQILNVETIAEHFIAAVAGSMGVVYTVPITSIVYALLNKDKLVYKKEAENRINGKRSLKL